MYRLTIALAALLISSGPVFAATDSSAVLRTDEILRRAGVADLFVNETVDSDPLLARHKATGMVCRFYGGSGEIAYDAATHTVTCQMRRAGYGYSLGATPAAPNDTVEGVLASAVNGVAHGRRVTTSDLSAFDQSTVREGALPANLTARIVVDHELWRISVARRGGWFVIAETVSLSSDDRFIDLQQALEWHETLQAMR